MIERITSAAVCYSGMIISMASPARHPDVVHKLHAVLEAQRADTSFVHLLEQGFVTSTGRYVGRKEAYMIAKEAGQLKDGVGDAPPDLYSEDVW